MKQYINYKVPNGKLIRLEIEIDNKIKIFKSIKIYGDFFIHPEIAIIEIENLIIGKNYDDLEEINLILNNFIKENNIKLIGFEIIDLIDAFKKLIV